MKKFYSLAISAIVACSAWAAPGFTYVGPVEAKAKAQNPTQFKQNIAKAEGSRSLDVIPQQQDVKSAQSVDTKAISMWTAIEGTGSICDDAFTTFFNVDPQEWEVAIEKHRALDIYRIQNPYANHPLYGQACTTDASHYMYINFTDPNNVYFCDANGDYAVFDTGVTVGQNGNLEISTYSWYVNSNGQDVGANMGGVIKNGVISFPDQTLIVHLTGYNNGQWQFGNNSKKMRIKLPGAKDYSISVENDGHCVHGDAVTVSVTFGEDVVAAKCFSADAPFVDAGWEELIATNGQEFANESGIYKFTANAAEHTACFIMIVTLDEAGVYQESGLVEFVLDGSEEAWETFANPGHFYEGTISAGYGHDALDYDVTVQRNKTNNNLYRIVNPYTNGSWSYANDDEICHEGNHYFYINATDPAKVYVEAGATGLFKSEGSMMTTSQAYVENEWADLFSQFSAVYGTMDSNGLITLDGDNVLFTVQDKPGKLFHALNASTKLQLPENRDLAGISEIANDAIDANAPVEYYNLQGMRILNVENNPGLYIRKQGNTTTKVYMK